MKDPHERDLEEVERALSVLGGRHPEAVRAERQAAEAAAKRKGEHEDAAKANRRRALRRRALGVVVLVLVGGVGFAAYRYRHNRAETEEAVAPLVARYVAHGFDALPRGSLAAEDRAEVTTVAGDCYAFVAAHGASMQIARPIGSAGAKGEALVCTCASENIVVTSSGGAAVRALHVAGAALGGSRALAYRFADRAPTLVGGDEACADDALAAFARDAHYPKQDADGAWLAARPVLGASGFVTVASAPARLPFVFVPAAAASACFFAATPDAGDLTLWTLDGGIQKPVQHAKAIAWCAAKPATFVVERAIGGPTVSVVSAPSARIGGLVGLRDLATRAAISPTTWVAADERGAIAADTLRASVVPEPTVIGAQTITAGATRDVRVLVFSTDGASQGGTFSSNEADFRCEPPLLAGDALCVQARALTWHEPPPRNDGTSVASGAAYGPLPYWMSALADVRDPRVVDAELALVGFARRMTARGFVPGVIEGVTERDDSVEILGRSGDDAVVAVGVWPAPPYIHPYGDGEPWTLDGEPRVIPLSGGVRVTIRLRERPTVPLASRRTVVFRHSTK